MSPHPSSHVFRAIKRVAVVATNTDAATDISIHGHLFDSVHGAVILTDRFSGGGVTKRYEQLSRITTATNHALTRTSSVIGTHGGTRPSNLHV